MAKLIFVFGLLFAMLLVFQTTHGISCDLDRSACVLSCKLQNCGTGYCENRGGQNTCVCSRCGNGGGEWPNIPNIPGGKK